MVTNSKLKKNVFQVRIIQNFKVFIKTEEASGIILLLCTVTALILANLEFSDFYFDFWQNKLTIKFGDVGLSKGLYLWINDGLMAIFFFVVGLEIKREILVGELNTFRKATLPILAALGGMIFPAIFYIIFNINSPETIKGWGIPMATDIAFTLGVLALLGRKTPFPLKVFITSLAIMDDIGAIIIIALFYSDNIQLIFLVLGVVILLALIINNRLNIQNPLIYLLLGFFLWFVILQSGLHATIAGVLLAFTIPARNRINADRFVYESNIIIEEFQRRGKCADGIMLNSRQQDAIKSLETAVQKIESPLQRFERFLHYWVALLIIPFFILANAGVRLEEIGDIFHPITLGIFWGLVIGKPLGIILLTWLAVKSGLTSLPKGLCWTHIIGGASLAGIGFTMSLFISNLAISDPIFLSMAKLSILIASLISGLIGIIILSRNEPLEQDIEEYECE